jgi:hypothetical protein
MNALFVQSGLLTMNLLLPIVGTHTIYFALHTILDFTHVARLMSARKCFIKIGYYLLGFSH